MAEAGGGGRQDGHGAGGEDFLLLVVPMVGQEGYMVRGGVAVKGDVRVCVGTLGQSDICVRVATMGTR